MKNTNLLYIIFGFILISGCMRGEKSQQKLHLYEEYRSDYPQMLNSCNISSFNKLFTSMSNLDGIDFPYYKLYKNKYYQYRFWNDQKDTMILYICSVKDRTSTTFKNFTSYFYYLGFGECSFQLSIRSRKPGQFLINNISGNLDIEYLPQTDEYQLRLCATGAYTLNGINAGNTTVQFKSNVKK